MTQITKEAIEALKPFADAVFNDNGDITVDLAFAKSEDFIKAYFVHKRLSTLPIAVEGKVKALEWHESLTDDGREQWHSNDRESITVMGNSFSDHERYWLFHAKKGFPSLQEAKAAAQSDFETRILSALISSPGKDGGQEVEAVGPFDAARQRVWNSLEDVRSAAIARGVSATQPASTALAEAVSVPDGWLLVPKEPTQEMLDAVTAEDQHEPFSDRTMGDIFVEMCSAAPSTPNKVDEASIIERCALLAEKKAKDCLRTSWNFVLRAVAEDIRALKAKSPSSELSAQTSSPGKDGGQEVEAVARWLVEEELPSGSKRWEVFEHELHARNVAARYNHRNKTTVTPLYTRPQPASTAMVEALEPFSRAAGELYARNWNASQVVMSFSTEDDIVKLTAGDFFAARSALSASTSREGESL